MPVFRTVSPAGLAKAIKESNGRYALNNTGSTLSQFTVVAWSNGGSMIPASAVGLATDELAGVLLTSVANGQYGLAMHSGKLPGAVASLGAFPGQAVFLDEVPGKMTLDTSGFQPTSAIIRIGFAEPADNTPGSAVDLTLSIEVISQP